MASYCAWRAGTDHRARDRARPENGARVGPLSYARCAVGESADKILEDELAKLGAAGGAIGGAIGSAAGAAATDAPYVSGGAASGAAGGALGAKIGNKLLKDSGHEESIELDEPADAALRRVVKALDDAGEIRPTESDAPGARAVIGSGFLSMNPAVVDASLEPIDDKRTRVVLRASAKEGLIKQKTAEKAIEQVSSALRGAG
jgi:outer membrane lipoprotein SlyB